MPCLRHVHGRATWCASAREPLMLVGSVSPTLLHYGCLCGMGCSAWGYSLGGYAPASPAVAPLPGRAPGLAGRACSCARGAGCWGSSSGCLKAQPCARHCNPLQPTAALHAIAKPPGTRHCPSALSCMPAGAGHGPGSGWGGHKVWPGASMSGQLASVLLALLAARFKESMGLYPPPC